MKSSLEIKVQRVRITIAFALVDQVELKEIVAFEMTTIMKKMALTSH